MTSHIPDSKKHISHHKIFMKLHPHQKNMLKKHPTYLSLNPEYEIYDKKGTKNKSAVVPVVDPYEEKPYVLDMKWKLVISTTAWNRRHLKKIRSANEKLVFLGESPTVDCDRPISRSAELTAAREHAFQRTYMRGAALLLSPRGPAHVMSRFPVYWFVLIIIVHMCHHHHMYHNNDRYNLKPSDCVLIKQK